MSAHTHDEETTIYLGKPIVGRRVASVEAFRANSKRGEQPSVGISLNHRPGRTQWLTPEQARELGAALIERANRAEAMPDDAE